MELRTAESQQVGEDSPPVARDGLEYIGYAFVMFAITSRRQGTRTRGFTVLELLIVLAIVAILIVIVLPRIGACASRPGGADGHPDVAVGGGVAYEPPVVPIKISLTRKGISASIEGRVLTPFGKFSAFTEASFPDKKTLTLVLGKRATVYELDNKKHYTVEVPNDLKGRTRIHTDGNGNLRVVVPEPVVRRRADR